MHKEVKGGMPAGYRVPKANKGAHAFRDAAAKITASERLLMAAVKPKTDVSRDLACPSSGTDGVFCSCLMRFVGCAAQAFRRGGIRAGTAEEGEDRTKEGGCHLTQAARCWQRARRQVSQRRCLG